ncbi:MAG: glycosyltransferase family 39 protein [Salinivirgaceae bacterium]|jgi:hypothetical protein|nr:glycosyltransferase family 39 protein [Salinivirgaceae bacterium]
MRFSKTLIPLILILVIAAIVRFYKLPDQSLTHDEFSTLFRLEFNSLHDVIQIGMKEMDNHPIGTQVFYYYYTKLFGKDPGPVKFPIIIFGIFSVFMVYVIGKKWFNTSAALYSASFMAILQYAVAQSQIARMYGFGIPFILLMVYYWDKLIKDKFLWRNAIAYILAASICSYTHYFSLLFAAIVWITGAFLINKNQFKYYFISGLFIFLLFVPHLDIFFYQLSKGGIEGWLGKFSFSYFFKYISYIFHHSIVVSLVAIIPIVLFFKFRSTKNEINYRIISLVWFLTPMLIGFLYSYFRNNVIHERVLYFSFPFLLLFLASFMHKLSFKKDLILVISILIVGVGSLIIERNHFKYFNNHRYKLVANRLIDWTEGYGKSNLLTLKITHKRIDSCYNSWRNFDGSSTIYFDSSNNTRDLINLMENSTQEYLYFGRAEVTNPTYLAIVMNYFPQIVKKEFTISGEAYLLKKASAEQAKPCSYWNYYKNYDNQITSDTNNNFNSEYFANVELLIDTIIFSRNNIINIEANIKQIDSIGGAKLVWAMEKKGNPIDWRSCEIDDYILKDSSFNKVVFSIPLPDIKFPKNTQTKVYVWNPNNANYLLNDIKISTIPGNPFSYGKTNKIPFNKSRYCLNDF